MLPNKHCKWETPRLSTLTWSNLQHHNNYPVCTVTNPTITLEYATITINLRSQGVRLHQPKQNMKTSNQGSYDKRPSSSQLLMNSTLSNPNEELLRVHSKTSLSNIPYKQPRHHIWYISKSHHHSGSTTPF